MSPWEFNLGQTVGLIMSDEQGEIIGRAEYPNAQNAYLVRYRAADGGHQVQRWWDASALKAVAVAT